MAYKPYSFESESKMLKLMSLEQIITLACRQANDMNVGVAMFRDGTLLYPEFIHTHFGVKFSLAYFSSYITVHISGLGDHSARTQSPVLRHILTKYFKPLKRERAKGLNNRRVWKFQLDVPEDSVVAKHRVVYTFLIQLTSLMHDRHLLGRGYAPDEGD